MKSPDRNRPDSEPELLLPPLRMIATIVSALTAAFLAAILFAHLFEAGPAAPTSAQRDRAAPAGKDAEPIYPYNDARNVGMY